MHTFRVWATLPKKISVQVRGKKFAMARDKNDWWRAKIASAKIGDDYGFILDGQGIFPDPRSAFQPNGIDGLSQIVDHKIFSWADSKFRALSLSSAIIYELHIGTFTPLGTFISAIEKLDHLVALGVTHVELMPVNEFSGAHGWGYDGVDLFAPHHAYGTPDDLKKLVDACHARKLAVILDVVYNHFGPAGNYLDKFAPYFTKKYSSPWGPSLNFDDAHSHEVRRFFCDNALMWLRDYHFDGLRLDAVHAIFDTSAVHFLEQLKIEVEKLSAQTKRNLFLIAESDLNDPRLLHSRERGGLNLDAQWSDDFHHALHAVLTGEKNGYYEDFGSLADLASALKNVFVYAGKFSKHRQRVHGRTAGDLSGNHFLGYLQNHDQVGNRAKGERSRQLLNLKKLKIGAALVLTSPFVPMIFQGEEWGASTPFQYFTNHQDKKLGDAVREGRRREFAAFGWKPDEIPDPQARETFENSKLNWDEISQNEHAEILDWFQKLIFLRQKNPGLRDGNREALKINFDEKEKWLVMARRNFAMAANFSRQARRISFAGKFKPLLSSEEKNEISGGQIFLQPESVLILQKT
jgi:maltooligosyltrehalose trehalohydrolase